METRTVDEIKVKCEICLKEMPRSEARSAEMVDYVVHFCGLDCYEEWIERRELEELKILTD